MRLRDENSEDAGLCPSAMSRAVGAPITHLPTCRAGPLPRFLRLVPPAWGPFCPSSSSPSRLLWNTLLFRHAVRLDRWHFVPSFLTHTWILPVILASTPEGGSLLLEKCSGHSLENNGRAPGISLGDRFSVCFGVFSSPGVSLFHASFLLLLLWVPLPCTPQVWSLRTQSANPRVLAAKPPLRLGPVESRGHRAIG